MKLALALSLAGCASFRPVEQDSITSEGEKLAHDSQIETPSCLRPEGAAASCSPVVLELYQRRSFAFPGPRESLAVRGDAVAVYWSNGRVVLDGRERGRVSLRAKLTDGTTRQFDVAVP